MRNRPPQFDPLTSAAEPTELPPRAFLTNDERLMERRSMAATEREKREEYESVLHQSPFG